jgi:hypothetical protein
MNFVYKLTFNKRKQSNIKPYFYIGSKSNCTLEEGVILDKRGKPYYGSSTLEDYDEIVNNDNIEVEILKVFDEYIDALNYESYIQKELDVVANIDYFNLSIATVNNYTDPNYATYKHALTGKTVRLPRDHKLVISGEYVGISKGTTLSPEERKRRGRSGKENPFYGKTHSDETKLIISLANSRETRSPEKVKEWVENVAKKPKSEEHKRKIGRKGMIVLKNRLTGETVRIKKDLSYNYDLSLWVNPYILSENKSAGSKWITDGTNNKKIKYEEIVPEGWKYGRTYTNWNSQKKETK